MAAPAPAAGRRRRSPPAPPPMAPGWCPVPAARAGSERWPLLIHPADLHPSRGDRATGPAGCPAPWRCCRSRCLDLRPRPCPRARLSPQTFAARPGVRAPRGNAPAAPAVPSRSGSPPSPPPAALPAPPPDPPAAGSPATSCGPAAEDPGSAAGAWEGIQEKGGVLVKGNALASVSLT